MPLNGHSVSTSLAVGYLKSNDCFSSRRTKSARPTKFAAISSSALLRALAGFKYAGQPRRLLCRRKSYSVTGDSTLGPVTVTVAGEQARLDLPTLSVRQRTMLRSGFVYNDGMVPTTLTMSLHELENKLKWYQRNPVRA